MLAQLGEHGVSELRPDGIDRNNAFRTLAPQVLSNSLDVDTFRPCLHHRSPEAFCAKRFPRPSNVGGMVGNYTVAG